MDRACVLIVDDDRANRLILRALLRESGFTSLEAQNGRQAVDMVAEHDVDIVLLDVMMPIMDGYEAAKRIKQQALTFIPIIFLTAMSDEKALTRCIEVGGDDFLTKPYNHTVLRAKIDSMLRIRKLYIQIEQQHIEIARHNARIQQEVNVARKVFGNMLSHNMTSGKTGLRYSMSPMSIFNGDVILAERNQANGLDILISDFTGHGLSAAIGSIPVADVFYTMTRKGFANVETLAEANSKLITLLPTQMFMAAALISIDRANSVVTVINCGLPDLYLWRRGKVVKIFPSGNVPLGIVQTPGENYVIEMAGIEFGDRIYGSTDGIIEITNESGELYGRRRILESIESAARPELIFDRILHDSLEFMAGNKQSDDITLLELTHLEHVEYDEMAQPKVDMAPAQWSMQFDLDIDSLRHFDLLPYIMQGVNGLQSIPNSRASIHTILTEIYANALDHGVLKLDSSMKNSPDGYMKFYREKARRLDSYEQGSIQLSLSHELKPEGGGRLTIHVIDSGCGFDFSRLDTRIDDNTGYAGRGIGLISQLCKEVRFFGKGNAMMAVYEWD